MLGEQLDFQVSRSLIKGKITMELLLSCHNISKSFGNNPLFRDISFSLCAGDKVGLIGANGAGKTTLLSILMGKEEADHGQVTLRSSSKFAFVEQSPKFDPDATVLEAILQSALKSGLSSSQADYVSKASLSQIGFKNFEQNVGALSGGWQKRLAIAAACIGQPDLIFFDEPTNHLDWEGILWLESFLKKSKFTWLMISHDRYLLSTVCKKILDLDRKIIGGLLVTENSYEKHIDEKRKYLEARRAREESLSNKIRRETEWLQRGPKARSTKAKYRIDHAEKLINEMETIKLNNKETYTDIEFSSSKRKTKKLIQIESLNFSYPQQKILNNFSTTITSNYKLGILGMNGVGKSSLFKIILQEIKPQSGKIVLADQLKIVYFDQNRQQISNDQTLEKALCPHGDHVIYQGRSIHINSWASRFGFQASDLASKVEKLSGGEKARVLIANLMLQEADVLLLDEPTNDLDIPTLEILEKSLSDFVGAVLIISHDRYMLNRLCNKFLGFNGQGEIKEYADLHQWHSHLKQVKKINSKPKKEFAEKFSQENSTKQKTKKLSFNEQREYNKMEENILAAEDELEKIKKECMAKEIQNDPRKCQEMYELLNVTQAKIDKLYKRWTELEAMQKNPN